jgi:hypothetical protein
MITFISLAIIFVLGIIVAIILGGIGLGALILGFGDVIVGIIIVVMLIKSCCKHRKD